MKTNCPPAPPNKKEYITEVGQILVKDHGKKKYYSPEEVIEASKKSKYTNNSKTDWHCWAMCIFSSMEAFVEYHRLQGEVCNYALMKTEMLKGIALSDIPFGVDLTDVEIESSWLDFGEVFEGIFEGLGDFVSAVFEIFN